MGFPDMQGWFNIQKSINMINQINRLKQENYIIIELMQKKQLTKYNYNKALIIIIHNLNSHNNKFIIKPLRKLEVENFLNFKKRNIYKISKCKD